MVEEWEAQAFELPTSGHWSQALAEIQSRIAPRFARVEVRERAGRYLLGLLDRAVRIGWSHWRRAHQAVAARCHAARQAQRAAEAPSSRAVLPPAPVERALSDAEWERIHPLLPPQKPLIGRPRHNHRVILSGILAVVLTGASWREMPAEYGKWETAYKRYRLWCDDGRWPRILEALGLPATTRPPPQ